ncbi:MAG: DUF4349 domain-containing protein, partial [Chloroflexota bacterium]
MRTRDFARKMMVVAVVVGLLATAACAAPGMAPVPQEEEAAAPGWPEPEVDTGGRGVPAKEEAAAEPVPAPTVPQAPPKEVPGEEAAAEEVDRMIVRTGDVGLMVEDVPATIEEIGSLAESLGGYVVSSEQWREGERVVGSIAFRVPAEEFDRTLRRLEGMAIEVRSQQTSSEDVTQEYVDLEARLRNLRATEEQLLSIMEKAEKVEDVLAVQRELSNVRGEIERIKGRMQYLERTSAMSLIRVRLEQAKLDVEFTAQSTQVKSGEEVRFRPEVAGGFSPYSYQWDFGDGKTSTAQIPAHRYDSEGTYTVSLTVTDDRGSEETETRENYITVLPGWEPGNVVSGAWSALVSFGRG